MAKTHWMLAAYSAAHFTVDFSCAFLMFSVVKQAGDWMLCMLIYNFCAFALQMPMGIIADRLNRNCIVAVLGCVLVGLSFAFAFSPLLCAALAGVGNGMFHVGGGVDVLNISEKKAGALGVFVSPGAFGIYFGTMLAKRGWAAPFIFIVLLAAMIPLMLSACKAAGTAVRSANRPLSLESARSKKTILCIAALFLVVCLRSYAGMLMNFSWKSEPVWSLAAVCAVVLGKTAGGFAADRLGGRMTSAISLGAAAVLFIFSQNPFAGTAAVFLFNMTMSVTLFEVARIMPGAKGFSFGLLTFGLFIGFIPSYLGVSLPMANSVILVFVSAVSLAFMLPAVKRREM